MLPKKYRLRQDKDIKTLFSKGKSVFNSLCGIRFMKNNLEVSRFTVVVGVKISKKAVQRNRLKRQIRQIVQVHISDIEKGYDFIFIPQKELLGKTSHEISEIILPLFKKLKLCKK